MDGTKKAGIVTFIVFLFLGLTAAPKIGATTVNVNCNRGGAVGPILSRLKPGDIVLVHGTCQENILIQAELQRITLDGQRKATSRRQILVGRRSRSLAVRSRSKASR